MADSTIKALAFREKMRWRERWHWFETLVGQDPSDHSLLSTVYLIYVALILTGVLMVALVLFFGTLRLYAGQVSLPPANLMSILWLGGCGTLSCHLYRSATSPAFTLSSSELYLAAPGPFSLSTYAVARLILDWLRYGWVIWLAGIGLATVTGTMGGWFTTARAVGAGTTLGLAHLVLYTWSRLLNLPRLKQGSAPVAPRILVWLPLALSLAGFYPPWTNYIYSTLRILVWPLAAAVVTMLYPAAGWGAMAMRLGALLALFLASSWLTHRLYRRLPLAWVAEESWMAAAVAQIRQWHNRAAATELLSAYRLSRKNLAWSHRFLGGRGAWALLAKTVLVRWRRGWISGLIQGLYFSGLLISLATVGMVQPQNLPLILLATLVLGGQMLTGPFKGDIGHEEYLFGLPIQARWAILAELALPYLSVLIWAWPLSLVLTRAQFGLAHSGTWAGAMPALSLALPGLLAILALAWALDLLLNQNGVEFWRLALPSGGAGTILTGGSWFLIYTVATTLSRAGYPELLTGTISLALAGGISGVLLKYCIQLYRSGSTE